MRYCMNLYLKGYEKYDKSKLIVHLLLHRSRLFNFDLLYVLIPLEVKGYTVPNLKALRYGIYEARGLSCGSTSTICQGIMKSGNLLNQQGFVKTQSLRTEKMKNESL